MPEMISFVVGVAFVAVWAMIGHNLVRGYATSP